MFEYVVVLGWGNEFVFSSDQSALAMSFLSIAAKNLTGKHDNFFRIEIRWIEQNEQNEQNEQED